MQTFGIALCLCLGFCLSACGSRQSSIPVNAQASKAAPSPRSTPPASSAPDGDESSPEADNNNGDEEDSDNDAKEFHGYRCTDDCSGHEAGYEWAEEHEIHDPDDCGGKSESFIEGCRAWAEENPADEKDPEDP